MPGAWLKGDPDDLDPSENTINNPLAQGAEPADPSIFGSNDSENQAQNQGSQAANIEKSANISDKKYNNSGNEWGDGPTAGGDGGTKGVGAPGFAESLIPIWGSGRAAINDFQHGRYVWGTINTGLAISDIFLAKAIVTGIGKIATKTAWKTGSHTWRATRSWLGRTNQAAKGQHVHHWALHQNQGLGKKVPGFIKNQPWNLMNMPSQTFHNAVHGKGRQAFNLAQRVWYGSPGWFKATGAYIFGRTANSMR